MLSETIFKKSNFFETEFGIGADTKSEISFSKFHDNFD